MPQLAPIPPNIRRPQKLQPMLPGPESLESTAQPRPRAQGKDLKAQFGFSGRNATPEEASRSAFGSNRANAAPRLDVLPRGGTKHIIDGEYLGGGQREATREYVEPPSTVPTRAESAADRNYGNMQIRQAEDSDSRREADVERAREEAMAEAEVSAAIQQQAAKLAWEETYKMPYSDAAAKEFAQAVQKNNEDFGMMEDLNAMKADMDLELAQVDQMYPQDPMNPASPTNTARQRETDRIRQKYMLDMNQLLTVRTRRNIEMGKKGQPDPATADDINFGAQSGG